MKRKFLNPINSLIYSRDIGFISSIFANQKYRHEGHDKFFSNLIDLFKRRIEWQFIHHKKDDAVVDKIKFQPILIAFEAVLLGCHN